METNKDCNNCVWSNECYIQNAVKSYLRHRHPLLKINFSDWFCSLYESIDVIKSEIEKQNNSGKK